MLRSAWDGHVRQGSLRQPLAPAVSLRRSFSRFRESIPGECFRDNRNGATGSRVVARRGAQRVTPGHAKCTPGVEGSRSATGKIGGPGAGPGQGLVGRGDEHREPASVGVVGRRGRGPELSPPRPDGPEGQDRPRRPREFAAVRRHCCHALLKEAGWHECFLPCSHPPLFFAGRQPLDLPRPAAPPDGARFCGIALLINRDKQVRPRMTRHFAMPRSHAGSVLARASCPRRARGILVRITFFACPSRSISL